jgi:hypothetical protein
MLDTKKVGSIDSKSTYPVTSRAETNNRKQRDRSGQQIHLPSDLRPGHLGLGEYNLRAIRAPEHLTTAIKRLTLKHRLNLQHI